MNTDFNDPDYSNCPDNNCKKSWGLRVVASSDIHIYGAGLYSFFENYMKNCSSETPQHCQENMVSLEKSSKVTILNLNTVGAINMANVATVPESPLIVVEAEENANSFASTVMRLDLV